MDAHQGLFFLTSLALATMARTTPFSSTPFFPLQLPLHAPWFSLISSCQSALQDSLISCLLLVLLVGRSERGIGLRVSAFLIHTFPFHSFHSTVCSLPCPFYTFPSDLSFSSGFTTVSSDRIFLSSSHKFFSAN